MGLLLKLLTLVIGIALIFKLGLAQMVEAQLREVLVAVGADPQSLDLAALFTVSGLYAAIGALPQPFGALGKLVLTVVLAGLALSVLAVVVNTLLRMMRWVRDLFA